MPAGMVAPCHTTSLTLTRGSDMGMTVQKRSTSLQKAFTYSHFSSSEHLSHAIPSGYVVWMSSRSRFWSEAPCGPERMAMPSKIQAGVVSRPPAIMVTQIDFISTRSQMVSRWLEMR